MEIYVSIDGVLRNFIQKFNYHYQDYFLETEIEDSDKLSESFDYKIMYPIYNDDLLKYYTFQSKEEYNQFCYIDYSLELFGHAGISYQNVISDLNKIIHENKNINFTIVGIDELGKAKPSTLFFLSRNGFLGNNIKFILSQNIDNEWKNCDMWITDNEKIIAECPKNKIAVKFETEYNNYFSHDYKINKLSEIIEICSKYLENTTSSMWTKLLKSAVQIMELKNLRKRNH